MLALLFGAGILGGIIMYMEDGEFPGWLPMIACVLAAAIPAAFINVFLPPYLFFVGWTVGAICAGLAISVACGMTMKRAFIASGMFLAVQISLLLCLQLAFGG